MISVNSGASINFSSFSRQYTTKPNEDNNVSLSSDTASNIAKGGQASVQSSINDKKDFSTVAKDARALLDVSYKNTGKEANQYTTAPEWENLLGKMDRRSLYAISSNEGGQFSEAEQTGAQGIMNLQLYKAMGVDNNPAARANPTAAMQKAGMQFLDSVSDEEKTSMTWAEKRSNLELAYEHFSRREGQEPDAIESDSPLVKLIKGGFNNLRQTGDPSRQLKDTPEYQQAVQLSEQLKAGLKAKDKGGSARAVDITA